MTYYPESERDPPNNPMPNQTTNRADRAEAAVESETREVLGPLKLPYTIDHCPANVHQAESWLVSGGRGFGLRTFPTEKSALEAAEEFFGPAPLAKFTITLFDDRSQLKAEAIGGCDPDKLIERAIRVLEAERADLSDCPAHQSAEAARRAGEGR